MKNQKKSRLLAFLSMLLAAMLLLAACGDKENKDSDTNDTDDAQNSVNIVSSWVGSFTTSNAMGDVVSGHLINFYDDGTCKIFYGIKAGMQGHHYGVYEGTYSENTVNYTYVKADTDVTAEDSFEADLSGNTFTAKVWCLANYPNGSAGGIQYVRIPNVEPNANAEYLYIGSRKVGDDIFASYIELCDGKLSVSYAANEKSGTLEGSYKIDYSAVTDIDTPDYLILNYPAIAENGSNSETKVEFNDTSFISITLESDISFPRISMASVINADGVKDN
ncbi:MAG: hypothetical protein HFE63_09650 [Clostridiales bacterium]|nr:hypothetical protein [Clostridiales bacterium]